MARVLLSHPDLGRVRIEGHTDMRGDEPLSQQRAQAVLEHLVKKGVPRERLESVGYGANRPIADNRTREGRAKNRRIEFTILDH